VNCGVVSKKEVLWGAASGTSFSVET